MTTQTSYVNRQQQAINELRSIDIHQMIVTDPQTIYYFTGEMVHPMERVWALFLSDFHEPILFANRLFKLSDHPYVNVTWFSDTDDSAGLIHSVLRHDVSLGIDQTMSAGMLLRLQELKAASSYQNTSAQLDAVIGRKTKEEQALMIEASRINDIAMEQFQKLIQKGITEKEVASQLESIYHSLGAEGHSFQPIVSFGANCADPHHMPDDTVLSVGDSVLFDVGCIKDGYCSDMTRTFFYETVSDEQRKVYEIVRQANLLGEAAMKPNVPFSSADQAARDYIEAAGYGTCFTHRLGHSIGMSVHERGDVSATNHNLFEPGRCISCEPGIYLPGNFGVRIEDLVIITETGAEVINHYPKDLIILTD